MQDNISKFYGAFSKKYDNFGSEQEFRDYLKGADRGKIDNLYKAFSKKYDNFGSADEMISYLGWSPAEEYPEYNGTENPAEESRRKRQEAKEGMQMFDAFRKSRQPATSSIPQAPKEETPAGMTPEEARHQELEEMVANRRENAAEQARQKRAEAGEGAALFEEMRREHAKSSPVPRNTEEKEPLKVESMEDLQRLREGVKDDQAIVDEYEAKKAEFDAHMKELSNVKGDVRGMDFHKYDAEKEWLDRNAYRYEVSKKRVDEVEAAGYNDLVPQAMDEVAEARKQNKDQMASPEDVIALQMTPFSRRDGFEDNPERTAADEIYTMAEQTLKQGSKHDKGYEGNGLEQLWTAARQFVEGGINNVDRGSLTMGLSEGTALWAARKAGEKYNDIITSTVKDLGYSNGEVENLMSDLESKAKEMEPIARQLEKDGAKLEAMRTTLEDMEKNGASKEEIRRYAKEYDRLAGEYNKLYKQYETKYADYKKDRDKYDEVAQAVEAALQGGLTGGEQALLDAVDKYTRAKYLREKDVSKASAAGAGFEQTLEFMLDFFLTGGIQTAGDKLATKLTVRHLEKKLGKDAVAKMAVKEAIKPTIGYKMLTDLGVAAARTTALVPRNIQTYGEQLAEYSGKDELGRYQFDRSRANAAGNTIFQNLVEYWSEGVGEYLSAGEQALFRNVTGRAPREAIGKTLKGYRASIGNFLDHGKFNGTLNEMLEEVAGSSVNALAGWLSSDEEHERGRIGDAKALSEFVAGEQLATTFLSFLPLSAIGAATNISAYNRMARNYEKSVNGLQRFVDSGALDMKELDNLADNLRGMTPVQAKDEVVKIADKVRKANGGKLPEDFAQNVMGYLEGKFSMDLRHDAWEDSQEKMAVATAYATNFENPRLENVWDLNHAEQTTKAAALDAGFTEDFLDRDAYVLSQEVAQMRETDPRRADVLEAYSVAKASAAGSSNGFRNANRERQDRFDAAVRQNLDRDGIIVEATMQVDGQPKTVFITSKGVRIGADGSVSTPTGVDGPVLYRDSAESVDQGTVMASQLTGAKIHETEEFIRLANEADEAQSQKMYEAAQKAVSPAGQAEAIAAQQGNTIVVSDNRGVYQPVKVERMTHDGYGVVISGDKKALQGIAMAMGRQVPAGGYLEAPVNKLWYLLAKEDDGSLSTMVPDGKRQAPAKEMPEVDVQPGAEYTVTVNGAPTKVEVDQVTDTEVWFNYRDADGNVKTGFMTPFQFQENLAEQTAAVDAQAPAVETEAPASAQTQAEARSETPQEVKQARVPVNEETGEKIYDHPSVTPEAAFNEIMGSAKPGSRDEANRVKAIDRARAGAWQEHNIAEAALEKAKREKLMVDEWELPDDESLDAFEQRKARARADADARIAELERQLPELKRKAEHWDAVQKMAEQRAEQAAQAQAQAQQAAQEAERKKIQRKVMNRAKKWEKLTGVKVKFLNTPEEVAKVSEGATAELKKGNMVYGWYNNTSGLVYIYTPAFDGDLSEIDKTYVHEVVSHKGLRGLLGEDGYNELCDRVWNELMTPAERKKWLKYNNHLTAKNSTEEYRRRAAADEYIANLSENLDSPDNQSLFDRLVGWVKEILDRLMSAEDIEAEAKAKVAAAESISKELLKELLADSMARYVSQGRASQADSAVRRDIGANVGGAVETNSDEKTQDRFSMKSIVTGGGLNVIEDDGMGNVAFETDNGRRFDAQHPITAEYLASLDNTVLGYMMKDAREYAGLKPELEARIWQAYADQLNAFLAKGVTKDGLSGADRLKALWQWEVENTVYKSVSENGDAQYSYSIDITRVCKKNEAVIKAISAMQRRLGYGITPGQIMDIYLSGIEEGYQVPCPVCYVFSRYIRNGIVATVAINGQKKWGKRLVDPSTLTEKQKQKKIQEWFDLLKEQERLNEENKKEITKAKTDCTNIIEQIDTLSQLITSGRLTGKARADAIRRIKALDAQYKSAFEVISQSSLTGWIKQFAIKEDANGFKPEGSDKAYTLWGDTFQGFPEEYALDLRLTAETIEKYPAIQRLRNARGSAGGKEIHFASNNDIGDIPMMLGSGNRENYYQKAVKAETKKERDKWLRQATKRFKGAHKYAQQQSLRGGQRMWSWSDNIERLGPDVFVNLLQLQMLGGALQAYSKQLEGVNLVATMGGYVNGSLMGYGKGWQELGQDDIAVMNGQEVLSHDIKDTVVEKTAEGDVKRERVLAQAGAPVFDIDGKKVTLLFDDVVGIDAYGRDRDGRHLKGLFDLNRELDKAGNILVGMNDTHVRAALADPRVFFVIPWHASGNSVHIVQQMLRYLGVDTDIKDYSDYTNVQEEKNMAKGEKAEPKTDDAVASEEAISENGSIRPEIIDFWEDHKNETDYPVGIEGGIPSGENGELSEAQKHYRELRNAIFLGVKVDTGRKTKDGKRIFQTKSVREFPEMMKEIEGDAFLSQALRKVDETVDDKLMTNNDTKFIYPYEYWNEESTYDTADENGARYLEYCRRLGYKPKFVGKLDSNAKDDFGNFAGDKGYWKLLIDRRMYGVDGRFQDLTPTTTENYDPKLVDPEWTRQNFTETKVADDHGAERIAERAIEKELGTFGGVLPSANYGSTLEKAVEKYNALKAVASKMGIKDLVEQAAPEAAIGGAIPVESFRKREAPAPKKTQKVYKLMRLGEDGKLYPLFIDRNAMPIELGTWYDADSPSVKDLEGLEPGYAYKIDADGNVVDRKPVNRTDKSITRLPNVKEVNEASENGQRWITVTIDKSGERSYHNVGINGAESTSTYAMRPGWHAGSLPTMRQIGKGAGKNLRDDNFVWVEGEISADKDYNEEAQGNPLKDIPTHIPTDGYYMKATNANKKASQADRVGWYVAGAFKPDRIMSDSEARQVIDSWNAEHPETPVEYDWPRESGREFNAETMQLEEPASDTRFRKMAPNGQPSNLTDEQWDMVRTPEFKAWFGDWENDPKNASKVVDENGEPLVMYHGTRYGGFNQFDTGNERWPRGAYFTRNEKSAQGYANYDDPEYDESELDRMVYPVFLNVKNPLMVDSNGGANVGDIRIHIREINDMSGHAKAIIDAGYDGVIALQGRDEMTVVFSPNQIKSATNNNGKFDPNNPDIRFRKVEPIVDGKSGELFDAAKERFGTTNNLREAGYALPDGTLLDFSGRHWRPKGEDTSWLNGQRSVDHRDIQDLNYEPDGNTPTGRSTDMSDFIRRGAIRLNSGVINLAAKPTREQEDVIRRVVSNAEGDVDLDFGDGYDTDHYAYYKGARPERVVNDIRRYFDEGEKPSGNIRFRKAVTPEQDKEYMNAVEAGDMEKAGQMVRDAFKAAFPNTKVVDENGEPLVVYHGSPETFTEFETWGIEGDLGAGSYFTDDKSLAETYTRENGDNQWRIDSAIEQWLEDHPDKNAWDDAEEAEKWAKENAFKNAKLYPVYLNFENPRYVSMDDFKTVDEYGHRYLKEGYEDYRDGYDGIIDDTFHERFPDFVPEGAKQFLAFSPEQIKLADPVTYDDNGNVIPLSERFNPENNDIRFRRAAPMTEEQRQEKRVADASREATIQTLDSMTPVLKVGVDRIRRDRMPDGHKTDKGYYDADANRMYVCMDNVSDERDAVATVFHETVGYRGLRYLFGEQYRDMMARMYGALDNEGKAWVNGYMARHGLQPGDEAIATGVQEYLARTAERVGVSGLEKINEVLGKTVDELFGTVGFSFTDNELAYVLRAAYEHAKDPAWLDTIQGRAKDTLMKRELGINETDPKRPTDPETRDAGIRFRRGDTGVARTDYEADLKDWRNVAIMEHQNADLPVKIGMERAMKEVGKKELDEAEDYLTRHNVASSRAETEAHNFLLFHYQPMIEKVKEVQRKIAGKVGLFGDERRATLRDAYQRTLDYLYAVSGLERNEWERNNGGEAKDWSGLTSLTGHPKEEWQEAEDDARAMIQALRTELRDALWTEGKTGAEAQDEADALLDQLWDAIRSCTDFTLDHALKYGLITEEEYNRLHGREKDGSDRLWKYYLPLRGFNEKTAEETFSYAGLMARDAYKDSDVVKGAKGRWTQADNPIANILNIAQREIAQGNENWARQALLRFTIGLGKNSLLSERNPWYEKVPNTKGKWRPAEPYAVDPNTGEPETLEDFEARMMQGKANGETRQGRQGLKLDQIMANKGHRHQHLIRVKVGGNDRVIWVNGDPAFAKAVSGYGKKPNYELFRSASRVISNFFTTYSLDFTAKNLIRDSVYSRIALLVKEDGEYRWNFLKNWWGNFGYGAFAFPMMRLAAEWDSGKLQSKPVKTEREQMFIDFMTDGGQTGYTVVRSVEKLKKDLMETMDPGLLKRAVDAAKVDVKGVTVPILGIYSFGVRTLNEAFELLTRFTTYQTSRQMGRTGQQAAYDAKEISVNFNRRGAQSGEGFWGQMAAYLGGTHYFYNAGVQGFDNFLRLYKTKPQVMTPVSVALIGMGILTPFLNSLMAGAGAGSGDGGNDDWYWNLPEWVRRNNIVLGWGTKKKNENGEKVKDGTAFYLALPLPVEFRALYGLGDITASAFVYHKMPNRTFGRVSGDILATAGAILPFNPVENYNSTGKLSDSILRSFTPDIMMPIVDIATNRDYTGRALMKENPFTKVVPKNQGAYASTPRLLVDACQQLGATLGVDIPPGVVRDIASNWGGGFYKFAEDISKEIFTDADRPRRWDDIPFLSGFTGHIDQDRSNTFVNNVLTEYQRLSQKVVLQMNLRSISKDITEKQAYEEPETLPAPAIRYKVLHPKEYELGKMYYFGKKDKGTGEYERVEKVHKTGKQAGKRYKAKEEIKIPGVDSLRKAWQEAREKWAALPNGSPEKALAYKDVTNAWHEYYDAQANLADELMNFEYGKKQK